MPSSKSSLPYLEIQLTDHCNLNCKGCSYFSPIADEWFADPAEHEKDMNRLRELFADIKIIRLMGGEPLLHKNMEAFLFSTCLSFPDAEIRLVSNGSLLPRMQDGFWNACKTTNTILEITLYPPLLDKQEEFALIAKRKGVAIWFHKKTLFTPFINMAGNSDLKEGFRRCRQRMSCPMLKQGKIYYCFLSATISSFNKYFSERIPTKGFVSIYDLNVTGKCFIKILILPLRRVNSALGDGVYNQAFHGKNLKEKSPNGRQTK